MYNSNNKEKPEIDIESFIIRFPDGFIDWEKAELSFGKNDRVKLRVKEALEAFSKKKWKLQHLKIIKLDRFKSELDGKVTSPGKKTFEAFKNVINEYAIFFNRNAIGHSGFQVQEIEDYLFEERGNINQKKSDVTNTEMLQVRNIIEQFEGKIVKLNAEKARYQEIINKYKALSDSIDDELNIAEKQLKIANSMLEID